MNLVGIGLLVAVLRSLIRRWRRATRPERRLYAPVYAAGVALMFAVIGQLAAADGGLGGQRARRACSSSRSSRSRSCPTCSSAAFVRARMAQGGAVGELMSRLNEAPRAGQPA